MKVYYDGIIYSWQETGGVWRYCNELILGASKNNDVEPILLLRTPSFSSFPNAKNIRVCKVFNQRLSNLGKAYGIGRKALAPLNQILLERYFSHVSSGVFHSTYYSTFRNLKIPQVLTVHDLIQERFSNFFHSSADRRFIERKKLCIERADVILCNSETTKQDLQNFYAVDANKITVTYLGVGAAFQKHNKVTDKEIQAFTARQSLPFLLYVGQRGLYKNFKFLLYSFAHSTISKNYILVVAGGGKLEQEEREYVHSLGLTDKVVFLGRVKEYELKKLYTECLAFIYPSLYEGFGLPIIEALSCGAKVLASDIPAFKEVGGSFVSYFNPENSQDLISKLDKLRMEDKNRLDQSLLNSWLEKFTWDRMLSTTLQIYRQLDK